MNTKAEMESQIVVQNVVGGQMNILKNAWQNSFSNITKYNQDKDRPLVIMPLFGHYGVSGYQFTVEGSPDKGSMLYDLSREKITIIHPFTLPIQFLNDDILTNKDKKSIIKITRSILEKLGFRLTPGEQLIPFVIYISKKEYHPEKYHHKCIEE